MSISQNIPSQSLMKSSIHQIPIEYFEWGSYPDHFTRPQPHRHDFDELMFFQKGNGRHEINFEDYDVQHNSVHYIPKSTVHYLSHSQKLEGFTISFDSIFFEKNQFHKFVNPISNEPFILNMGAGQFDYLKGVRDQMNFQIRHGKGRSQRKCFLLAMELMLNSIGSFLNQRIDNEEQTVIHPIVREFKQLILKKMHLHHDVSWYAQQLNISPKYLANLVKNETGTSAKKYILQMILSKVKNRLFHSNQSISVIADDFNYDASSLGKIFQKHVGLSMSEYRDRLKVEK